MQNHHTKQRAVSLKYCAKSCAINVGSNWHAIISEEEQKKKKESNCQRKNSNDAWGLFSKHEAHSSEIASYFSVESQK